MVARGWEVVVDGMRSGGEGVTKLCDAARGKKKGREGMQVCLYRCQLKKQTNDTTTSQPPLLLPLPPHAVPKLNTATLPPNALVA